MNNIIVLLVFTIVLSYGDEKPLYTLNKSFNNIKDSSITVINNPKEESNYIKYDKRADEVDYIKKFDNYNLSLTGKVNIPKNFNPFRISIDSYNIDDMGVWIYPLSLNSKKAFYSTKIKVNSSKDYNPAYLVYYSENNKPFTGMLYRVSITNITNTGEDFIFKNKFISNIKRLGNAERIISGAHMGGSGQSIKLSKNIDLVEEKKTVKFKDIDYISIRSGETIMLDLAYTAKETGIFLPEIELSLRYANANGKLKIQTPKIIVPKIAGWVDGLDSYNEKSLIVYKDSLPLLSGDFTWGDARFISWETWDNKKHEYVKLNFRDKKLKKADMQFLGKKNIRIFRNEIFAKKQAIFKSSELNSFFKSQYSKTYKPRVAAGSILIDDLTGIEQHNTKLSRDVEKSSRN